MTHTIDLLPIKPGAYTLGYFAICTTCSWSGPDRKTQGAATTDGLNHCKENA